MKKTYISPYLQIVEIIGPVCQTAVTSEQGAVDDKEQGIGGEDQEGSDALIKGDRNLWDEEW